MPSANCVLELLIAAFLLPVMSMPGFHVLQHVCSRHIVRQTLGGQHVQWILATRMQAAVWLSLVSIVHGVFSQPCGDTCRS